MLAALALWTIRFEFGGKAATRLEWAAPAAFAVLAALVLLVVSAGKRFELWAAVIIVGLLLGTGAGMLKKVNQDHGRQLIRVPPAWDGGGAAALLLLLALLRFVTSSLMRRTQIRAASASCLPPGRRFWRRSSPPPLHRRALLQRPADRSISA